MTEDKLLLTRALNILAVTKALIEQARSLVPDLADYTQACELARDIRGQLDVLRLCSECGAASGNGQDVCDGCWDAYCERMKREDAEAYGPGEEEEEDGAHFCAECGALLGRFDGPLCSHCIQEDQAVNYDPDLDEQRDRAWEEEEAQEEQRELAEERDWEGEALALEEARLDAAVNPFED